MDSYLVIPINCGIFRGNYIDYRTNTEEIWVEIKTKAVFWFSRYLYREKQDASCWSIVNLCKISLLYISRQETLVSLKSNHETVSVKYLCIRTKHWILFKTCFSPCVEPRHTLCLNSNSFSVQQEIYSFLFQ